jgi:hypothetical protein
MTSVVVPLQQASHWTLGFEPQQPRRASRHSAQRVVCVCVMLPNGLAYDEFAARVIARKALPRGDPRVEGGPMSTTHMHVNDAGAGDSVTP